MTDMLRTVGTLGAAPLRDSADFALVETSPRLADSPERDAGRQQAASITWHADARRRCPTGFLLIVGNEIFDAMPIRQFVKTRTACASAWSASTRTARCSFATGVGDPRRRPCCRRRRPLRRTAAIFEIAPAREAMMAAIADRIAGQRRHGAVHRLRPSGARLRRHVAGGAAHRPRRRRSPIRARPT